MLPHSFSKGWVGIGRVGWGQRNRKSEIPFLLLEFHWGLPHQLAPHHYTPPNNQMTGNFQETSLPPASGNIPFAKLSAYFCILSLKPELSPWQNRIIPLLFKLTKRGCDAVSLYLLFEKLWRKCHCFYHENLLCVRRWWISDRSEALYILGAWKKNSSSVFFFKLLNILKVLLC